MCNLQTIYKTGKWLTVSAKYSRGARTPKTSKHSQVNLIHYNDNIIYHQIDNLLYCYNSIIIA